MARQHTPPHLLNEQGDLVELEVARNLWSEDQLQELLYTHPELLPLKQIEPFFTPLVPLAREVGLPSGRLDLLYVNPYGLLTLVECKLWKNEEARRSVVGQILEYGNDTSRLTYTELEVALRRARNEPAFGLFAHVQDQVEALDEAEFVDDVNRNLRRGRFLLLVVGDGIRERTEGIATYLQAHAHLNFTFSLVELALHRLPKGGGVLVQPRVLVRTLEIERAVVRLEDGRLSAKPATETPETKPSRPRRRTVSLQVFLEELAETDAAVAERLEGFLDRATDLGLETTSGSNTIMLKLDPDEQGINFGIFLTNGTFENKGMADRTKADGEPIGMQYLEALAGFVGGRVRTGGGKFHWAVRNPDGSRVRIAQLLAHEQEWLQLIEHTINEFGQADSL